MGTTSTIILKIREVDKGRKVKFDKKKIPTKFLNWRIVHPIARKVIVDQRGEDLCEEVELDGDYIGIYCNWDGDRSGVGEELKSHYYDYETILNLICGGFCSSIVDGVRHYANKSTTEKWEDIKPIQGSLEDVARLGCNYTYIFEDGKWNVTR